MIDTNELRNDAKTAHYGHLPLEVSGSEVLELLDRLEAAEKERDDVMRDAKRYRFLRAAKNIPISTEAARDPVVYDAAIDAAMLARAPEDKS